MTARCGSEDTALREARANAVQRHLRALEDDWRKALPRLLDELDAIDREHAAGTGNGTVIGQYPAAEAVKPPVKPATRRRTRT